ncbi:MAG: NAD(P)/FAD-dependent oxidoreductase [Polyangiaceae bacterium]|nr:NAD(P)/FAD-dependent oxidoreductase [Polyangiaceae bacterium]
MAKTPLYTALLRALARQPTLESARQWRGARRLSRRALLSGVGAVGGAALTGCGEKRAPAAPASKTKPPRGPRVAVVGAGLAGLHAARRLREAGVEAEVFEAAARVGGRVFSDRRTFAPQHCELGGELIDTGHLTMHALREELDLRFLDYDRGPKELGLKIHFAGSGLEEPEILQAFAPVAAAIDDSLKQLKDPEGDISYRSPNGAQGLDQLSIDQWFTQHGISGWMRDFLAVAYTTEFGLEPDESNALNLLWMISTELSKFKLYGDSDERFHTQDGNEAFVQGLGAKLDSARMHLRHALVAIKETPAGAYRLSFEGQTKEAVFDEVILALPFTLLRDVKLDLSLPPVKRRAIDELGYGRNAKLMCGFEQRLWIAQRSNGETFSDLGYQSTWDTSRMQPTDKGLLTNFTGGAHSDALGQLSLEAATSEFLEQLDRVLPGAKAGHDGRRTRFVWNTQRWTRGSYSSWKVGQYTTIAGAEGEPVRGLKFAGEHTSLDFQGYMEGAALSGARAALEVLRSRRLEAAIRPASQAAGKIWELARGELDG